MSETCSLASFPAYLHDTQRFGLLHLAQDRSEDLVQLVPELGARPRDQRGHQPAHKGGRELGGPGVQQLVHHLHDVPQAAVPLLVSPLADLLQRHGDVRPQTLAAVLKFVKEKDGDKFTSQLFHCAAAYHGIPNGLYLNFKALSSPAL